ncbi:arginine--tRNA ligase [Candidatus Jorgensenbacteria bacterium]|nr:arginine--tRNA ligase [Candidatus Jorgensenbacteria bacterium]
MKQLVLETLQKITGEKTIDVSVPEIENFGDYSTNIAFELAKKQKKPPLQVAEELKEKLSKVGIDMFERIEIAKPGFVNFWIKNSVLADVLNKIVLQPIDWGKSDEGKGRTAIVEYFQLNVAKVPHVGHLRSAVIGDALKRILLSLGYNAVSDTHVGDWGTQFGILLLGYKSLSPEAQTKLKENPFEELEKLYVETNQRIENNPELRDEAKQEFAKLEQGDVENRKIWMWMVDISMKKLEESGNRLGLLKFDEHKGESAYEKDMPAIVELALKKNLADRKSDGAVIIDLTSVGLDEAVLIKSDGASTYLLRDLATIKYRKDHWKFWKNLYLVDVRQSHHFNQVFRVAELLGFEGVGDSVHAQIGFMSLPEGPMSSRKGTTIPLNDLVDDVVGRAEQIIKEKNPNIEDKDKIAHAVGVGALKYFDLLHHRKSDIVFNREQALAFEGNTGPYLQYTHARFKSILRKLSDMNYMIKDLSDVVMDREERSLAAAIVRFSDEVKSVLNDWAPSVLAHYLFELAQKSNNFYHSHPVVQESDLKKRNLRILLVAAAAYTLKNGLNLLGLEAPEEM